MSALTQRIEKTQSHQVQLQDEIKDLLSTMDESNVSDGEMQRLHDLNAEHAKGERELTALKDSERILFAKNEDSHRAVAIRQTNSGNGGGGVATATVAKPYLTTTRSPSIPKTRDERLDLIARAGVVSAIAHVRKLNMEVARNLIAEQYPHRGYGDDSTKAFVTYVAKAPTDPAMTSVVHWAEELVQTTYADYMDLLYPDSVLPKLAAQGLALNFGRAGRISIPTRMSTPSVSGSFVGEGMPIPVTQAAFQAIVLVPKKMAVITAFTREISEASIPAIEGLLRSAIQNDTAMTLDSTLLDVDPADAVRPAGLLNTAALAAGGSGAIAVTASTAATRFERVIEDVENLTNTLYGTHGHVRKMLYIMNPAQTLRISLTALPGVSTFPFIDQIAGGRLLDSAVIKSGTVPAGTVAAVDAADFVLVGGEAPRFEVSDQATLHMFDADPPGPQPITGGTPSPAVPVRSLWQTDSLGLRLILPVNWTMRRESMVAFITGVNW